MSAGSIVLMNVRSTPPLSRCAASAPRMLWRTSSLPALATVKALAWTSPQASHQFQETA